jgi:catechol 2,3-dioxygenase-like lactoylglutathione lyase family enzyme
VRATWRADPAGVGHAALVQPGDRGPIECISAVTLVTADMAAAVRFYEAAGLRVEYGGPGEPFTSLRAGEDYVNLQLDTGAAPIPAIWGRVIFWVDDVDAMHARLRAAGYEPSMDPSDAPWGERYFHVLDPDGHELSFARRLDAER